MRIIVFRLAAFLFFAIVATGNAWPATPSSDVPLGSPAFQPTPQRPIGWRGDGTGCYPGATPPTEWEVKRDGSDTSVKNVVWKASLPSTGVSSPIIVGEQIFVTSEIADLVCLDKKTGRVLWIRSNPEFEGLSDEDRKADPAYAAKLEPLVKQLADVNADLVEELNSAAAPNAPAGKKDTAAARKKDLEKQIQDTQVEIDKKRFTRYWAQASFGFSGPTPTSDGKRVCAFFTTGVAVCYDLQGNRKWIHRGTGGGSEHGNFASPLLIDNQLVVWAKEMRGYDVETGKLLWSNPARGSNNYGSLFRLESGGDLVAGYQFGYFVRIRDGKLIWDKEGAFGDSVATPIVVGNTIFSNLGYPRTNGQKVIFNAWQIPPGTDEGKLTAKYALKMDWSSDEIPSDKKRKPFDRGYVASPLFVDGLIYQLTQGGGLMVNDADTGEMVYRKVLPVHPKTEYWSWAGCSASPTLAGKYIYLMDNQGTTIVIEPGREYKEVAQNTLEELSKDGKQREQNLATPVFEGSRMYYRTPSFLYCIEKKR
jgi:outer membrane protein assembly factor BamB